MSENPARFGRGIAVVLTAALMLLWLPLIGAQAATPPYVDGVQISTDLRACDDPNLANCVADADFDNGNLGKAFAELDRVAFRAFVENNSPTAQVFHLRFAADNESAAGHKGYDLQSVPVASGACTITTTERNVLSPLGASAVLSISSVVEVTMASGASCAISYWQRLAIGSRQFSGSNLQSRILNGDYSSDGKETISIPVNQVLPQQISKTATTTATRGYAYTVAKVGTPAALPLNSCLAAATAANVSYTVSWTRTAQTAVANTVSGTITLTNPSTRVLTGTVIDQVKAAGVAVPGASATFTGRTVPAATSAGAGSLTIPYSITVPTGTVGALSNSASVVYDDPDLSGQLPALSTSVTVPAAVGAVVDGPSASALITDDESFSSGTGVQFKRLTPLPAMGAFATTNQFTESITSGTSGTISISKIVRATQPANAAATLRNRVTITPGGGAASAPVDVDIPITLTAANPTITVDKTLASARAADTTFTFTITNNDTAATTPVSVTVLAGATTGSSAPTSVAPSTTFYTVTETAHPAFLPAAPVQVGPLALCGSGSAAFTNVASTTALGIAKSANPASGTTVVPGQPITYSLSYFNTGNTTVSSAVVSDTLPAGVTFVSASNGGSENGGVVTWPAVSVAANTSAGAPAGTRTITVTVNSPLANGSVLTNYGFVDNIRSNPVTHTVSSAPALSIVKSSSPTSGATVAPGSTITYTLTYANTGNDAAVGAIISDPLPTTVTFVSASNGGTLTAGVLTWPAITIPAGGGGTRTITVTVNSPLPNGTVITNTGRINSTQSNAVTHVVASAPALGLVKSAAPPAGTSVAPGSTITYTLTYANTGNDAAVGAVITDPLPANTSFVSASNSGALVAGVVTFPPITVPAGSSGTRTITVTVNSPLPSGTVISNFGRINAVQSNTVTHPIVSAALLGLVKTAVPVAATPINPGATLVYTLTYSNTGTDAAAAAVITDPLPANTTFVSASDGGTLVAGVVTWPAVTIAVGASGTRTVTVTVNTPLANGTVIANFGRINATQSNTVQHPVSSAPVLGLVKSASPASGSTVAPGVTITYTLVYSNSGNDTALGAAITDPLPANTTFVSASNGGSLVAGVVTFPPVDIPAGASGTRTITVTVNGPLANGSVITNFGRINAVQSNTVTHIVQNPFVPPPPPPPPPPSPEPTPTPTPTPTAPALALIKSSDPADGSLVSRGSRITYTLTYSNTGNGGANAAVISDVVPTGTTFESASNGGTYDAATDSVRWVVAIAAGANGSVSFNVLVRPDAAGAQLIRNVADIDGVASNPVQQTVLVPGTLAVTKAVDRTAAVVGDVVAYRVTVGATGATDQTGVVVSDVVPAGSSYVTGSAFCAAPCVAAYDESSRTVTWTVGTITSGTSHELLFRVTVDETTEARDLRNTAVATVAGERIPSNEVVTVVTVVLGVKVVRPIAVVPELPLTGTPIDSVLALGMALLIGGVLISVAPRVR